MESGCYTRKRQSFKNDNEFYSKNKFCPKRKNWSKVPKKDRKDKFKKNTDKRKAECQKCKKHGHYANECKVKDTIKQLKITGEEKSQLIKVLELRNFESSEIKTPVTSSVDYSSTYSQSSSPKIQFGCIVTRCTYKMFNYCL